MPTSGPERSLSRVALDTSAYAELRRREDQVMSIVSNAEVVSLCATVLGELEGGFRAGSRYLDNKHRLIDFLAEPYVTTVDVTSEVSVEYGRVFAELRRAGTPIPVNDIWIAASALCTNSHLVTFDEDFRHVDGLPVTILRR